MFSDGLYSRGGTEPLFQLLSNLGLSELSRYDDLPGWVDMIEKKFVKQLYLEREKIPERQNSNDGDVYVYRKGQRSREEIPLIDIMRFIAEVFGEELPDMQLQDAKAAEEEEGGGEKDDE